MFTLKHKIKRRILLSLYASASLIVAFTLTFSPMATPKPIPIAEAGGKGGGGLATEASQLRNVAQNTIVPLKTVHKLFSKDKSPLPRLVISSKKMCLTALAGQSLKPYFQVWFVVLSIG
jgi:hypothetical protein